MYIGGGGSVDTPTYMNRDAIQTIIFSSPKSTSTTTFPIINENNLSICCCKENGCSAATVEQ